MSTIRDISLAPLGHKRIEWVKDFMPVLSALRERFVREQPFRGLRISVCVHLEAKTAYLALVLRDGGATVSVTGSNPLSTKDDICAALVEDGMDVHAFFGATEEEYYEHIRRVLEVIQRLGIARFPRLCLARQYALNVVGKGGRLGVCRFVFQPVLQLGYTGFKLP